MSQENDTIMRIGFELFMVIVYFWIGLCAILWIWVISGWISCSLREYRRAREQNTKVLPKSDLGPGYKFGTPAELTWTKSRGRVR
jgi:hypothetical protein